jgi:hypothetical protein
VGFGEGGGGIGSDGRGPRAAEEEEGGACISLRLSNKDRPRMRAVASGASEAARRWRRRGGRARGNEELSGSDGLVQGRSDAAAGGRTAGIAQVGGRTGARAVLSR